jgi:hypothetical protein
MIFNSLERGEEDLARTPVSAAAAATSTSAAVLLHERKGGAR